MHTRTAIIVCICARIIYRDKRGVKLNAHKKASQACRVVGVGGKMSMDVCVSYTSQRCTKQE